VPPDAGAVVPPVAGLPVLPPAGVLAPVEGCVGVLPDWPGEDESVDEASEPATAAASIVLPRLDGSRTIWLRATSEPPWSGRRTRTVTFHRPVTLCWLASTDHSHSGASSKWPSWELSGAAPATTSP